MARTWRKSKIGKKYLDKDKFRWEIQKRNRPCLRHNGGCLYCESNRLHNSRKRKFWAEQEIRCHTQTST
jgi:hypothetical protein